MPATNKSDNNSIRTYDTGDTVEFQGNIDSFLIILKDVDYLFWIHNFSCKISSILRIYMRKNLNVPSPLFAPLFTKL